MARPGREGSARGTERRIMGSAARKVPDRRYGSAAELASYAGLSVKTIRRLVDAGKVRGHKVGRRLLILVRGPRPAHPPDRGPQEP